MTSPDPGPIPAFLERPQPIVHTYTMLNTYANVCPHQAYRRYIKKDVPYAATPAMEWGNKVHEAFELRVGAGKSLPTDMQQWDRFARPFDGLGAKTEIKLAIDARAQPCKYFDNQTAWLRGKVDTAAIQHTGAFMADWKTGSSRYEDPYELEIGALLLVTKYPQVKTVRGAYVWLKEDRMGEVYDLSDVTRTWNKTQSLAGRIQDDRSRGVFEKRKSGLCGWCPVEDCEHHFVANR